MLSCIFCCMYLLFCVHLNEPGFVVCRCLLQQLLQCNRGPLDSVLLGFLLAGERGMISPHEAYYETPE